jgi:hypothetical protein
LKICDVKVSNFFFSGRTQLWNQIRKTIILSNGSIDPDHWNFIYVQQFSFGLETYVLNAESETGGILQEKSPPQSTADNWNTINSTTHSDNSTANSIISTANNISSTANNIISNPNNIISTANSINSNPNLTNSIVQGERRFSLSGLDTLLNELGRDHSVNNS